MSRKEDIRNSVDSVFYSNLGNAPKEDSKEQLKPVVKQKNHKLANGTNKKANYTITLKIDADIEDFFKNILWINRKTRNQYVNDLIRQDMLKLLGLDNTATFEEIQEKWYNYKDANNI